MPVARWIRRRSCLVVTLVMALGAPAICPAGFAREGETRESRPANVATDAEIAAWIRQLDNDQYAAREAAQQRLVDAGPTALDAIAEAAQTGSLESGTRATNILLGWAESKDRGLSIAALERIARLANRPAEAAIAASRLTEIRELAAIDQLERLGAVCKVDAFNPPTDPLRPTLQVIIGPKWTGGAEGLDHLRDMPRTTTVSFWNAPLGAEVVPKLRGLGSVKKVELFGLDMPDEAVANLRAAIPKVDVRGPCRLGISGNDGLGGGGAQVQTVVGTPALKAGLQSGDIIAEIDGTPVKDFPHLTEVIAKSEPGKSVKLKIIRQGAPLDISVAFDRWGDEIDPPAELTEPRIHAGMMPPQAQPIELPTPIVIPRRR